ncbi:hypothetical protein ACFXKG_10420 [Streptomyces sp. NPDC059255]|uniref:hypothetical protein n=1 Tax=Streptomyces sp. NPDC059255 TaxID=3346793 RepID=UPI00368D658F
MANTERGDGGDFGDAEQSDPVSHARLLPWTRDDGRPCYLMSASGDGYVSRLADRMESVQLDTGAEVLRCARSLITDQRTTSRQLRFVATRLSECLTDVLRIAESRGARLPQGTVER